MFFALAACQEQIQQPEPQEPEVEVEEVFDGEMQQVSFSVNITEAAKTKAFSKGLLATNLEYAVYRAENYTANDGTEYLAGTYIPSLSKGSNAKIEKNGDINWTVTLTLAKNIKYDIVFWAYATDAPYEFDEPNAQIKVTDNYKGKANAEVRDAFYALCDDYSVISSDTEVEMYRPFAQINFGASDYIPYVTDLGLDVTSTIDTQAHEYEPAVYEYDDPEFGRLLYAERPAVAECLVPTILNVLDGSVSGGAAVEFALTPIPYKNGEDKVLLTVEEEVDGEMKDVVYHWVSMNYILAPDSKASIDNIRATFAYNGEKLRIDIPSVPYRRNFKTNVLGDIFTGAAKFNVIIRPEYADTYVGNEEGFETEGEENTDNEENTEGEENTENEENTEGTEE